MSEFTTENYIKEVQDKLFNYKLLPDGRLDNNNLKSEYERGYVDGWNKLIDEFPNVGTYILKWEMH